MAIDIHKLWEEKIGQFSDKVRSIARGNDEELMAL